MHVYPVSSCMYVLLRLVLSKQRFLVSFRLCPSFVLTAIRELYRARAAAVIPSLLRSLDHVISLSCRRMDSLDCAALLFTLKHSDGVKLNLLWTFVPEGEVESILFMLDRVSQLRSDISARCSMLRMFQYSPTHRTEFTEEYIYLYTFIYMKEKTTIRL